MRNLITTLLLSTFVFFQGNAQSIQHVKSFFVPDIVPEGYCLQTEFDGKLYFASRNALWSTDGTENGTILIKSFSTHTTFTIYGLTTLNNQLIFIADDNNTGWELWTSDGTTIGTKLLIDINPGFGHGVYNPYHNAGLVNYDAPIAKINGYIYFYGNDGIHGIELWKSDGTTVGTSMVKDILTVPQYGMADTPGIRSMVTTVNNKIFFKATDTTYGDEMWVSDGTEAGTKMIKELHPGKSGNGQGIEKYVVYNDKVFFNIGYSLNITDGTDANTFTISNNMKIQSSDAILYNNKAYFYSGILGSAGSLIESDGTVLGTKEVFKIRGDNSARNDKKICLTIYKGNILFTGSHPDSPTVYGIWISDGTTAGTHMLFSSENQPLYMTQINNMLYFRMYDGVSETVDIWQSDGTATGTKKIPHGFTNYPTNGIGLTKLIMSVGNFFSYGNYIYFTHRFLSNNESRGLYRVSMFPDQIVETEKSNEIIIYPNPTQTEIIISVANMTGLSISNIAGIEVYEQKNTGNTISINTRNWAPGIYMAAIQTNDGQTAHRKIVKE